ncbi:hypothetical protein K8R14_04715 [bacterium]|nr:hypothetical protein [bacterium]
MDLVTVGLFAIGCILLGIVGGFAARSIFAGVILAVFVFVGWILWRVFKYQNPEKETPKAITPEQDA